MSRLTVSISLVLAAAFAFSGCSSPQAKLTYSVLPPAGADGTGYPFVIPRTVVKVTPAFDKASGTLTSVAFTSVPTSTTADGKPLKAFLATDASTSGWSLTPTTINAATYLDDLILISIGTQVTDNRSDAASALVTTLSLAGVFAGGSCATNSIFQPFIIANFSTPGNEIPHGKNDPSCYKYVIKPGPATAVAMKVESVDDLPRMSAPWFPIPACRSYTILIKRCSSSGDCTGEGEDVASSTVSISDGTAFRKVPLPSKGKVTMHADFCGADVTNDGAGGTNWGVLKELTSEVKSAKK